MQNTHIAFSTGAQNLFNGGPDPEPGFVLVWMGIFLYPCGIVALKDDVTLSGAKGLYP